MSEHEPRRITRRTALKWGALAAAAPAFGGVPLDVLAAQDSVVLLWNEAALQGVRDSRLGPPMVARALAIVQTSVFDAWAAYDHRSVGTRLGGALRRPPPERTLANINTAISFAAYRAAVDLFPGDRASVFDPLMRRLGLDPANATTDLRSPEGVGNVAAQAVLEYRHRDGANQLGDEPGGNPGVAYSDYTRYAPVNDPMDLRPGSHFDGAAVHDPNRWQPLRYVDASGAVVTQAFVGAHWHGVEADVKLFFGLTNAIFDASICCWDNKRAFDSARPITAIRYAFTGQQVRAWGGPYRGTRLLDGSEWLPYQASSFPTPPFAEYSSGHSTFSAAGAEILRRFTRSDRFGASATFSTGSSKVEAGAVPATDLTLHWHTFSDAANQAGLSRRYGGIHFEQADLDATAAGRRVAELGWARAQSYINGDLT